MIATPEWRNRLMQKLKAETCVRRKNETPKVRAETDERASSEERRNFLGTLSPDPWDFSLLMPIPVGVFLSLGHSPF